MPRKIGIRGSSPKQKKEICNEKNRHSGAHPRARAGLLSGCANNDTPADNAENDKAAETAENFTDEMKIPYAVNLSAEDGADSVERSGDHENSPYLPIPTSTTWSRPTR